MSERTGALTGQRIRNWERSMEVRMEAGRPLRENRQHGDILFPVSVYETRVDEGVQMPLPYHWHPETEIFFITSGKANFQVEGDSFSIGEGDVLLIKPNALHGSHDCFGTKLKFRALVFDYSFLAGIGNDRVEQEYLRPLLKGEGSRYLLFSEKEGVREELFGLLNRIYSLYEEREKGYELMIRALLLQVVYHVVRTKTEAVRPRRTGTRKSRTIRSIVEYVEEHYPQKIALAHLASHLSVSEGYLCRFFKENFYMTFVEYVQSVRLQKAQRLLLETDEPVGKIALDVGFGSGNYFATEFGRYYHTTPQKYRKGQDSEENGQY